MLSQRSQHALKNPWVIGLMMSFAVFVGANISFIYLAFSHSAQSVRHQDIDLPSASHHDEVHQYANADIQLSIPAVIYHQQSHRFTVKLQHHHWDGEQTTVTAYAYRPSNQQADFQQVLQQKDGQYQADLTFPLLGQWDLDIEVIQGDQQSRLTRRIYVHPSAS